MSSEDKYCLRVTCHRLFSDEKKKRDLNMLSDIMMDICRVYIKRISKNPIRHLFLVG